MKIVENSLFIYLFIRNCDKAGVVANCDRFYVITNCDKFLAPVLSILFKFFVSHLLHAFCKDKRGQFEPKASQLHFTLVNDEMESS